MKIIFLLACITFFQSAGAQDSLNSITELQHLLQQRKDRFETYAEAADKRSGILGTKTKKDLEQSREVLLDIVNLDNRIMGELNRAISTRGIAKADYSNDLMDSRQTIQRLSAASDTLYKQLQVIKVENEELRKKTEQGKWITYLFLAWVILFGLLFFFRRKR
jgi:hypothetical protein